MDSKKEFLKIISDYYICISDDKIPHEFLKELVEIITDFYYEQYSRFGKQYPKSKKRYSSFQLKDLEHPTTFEMIINYFKKKNTDNYISYSGCLLKMTPEEISKFEKNREEFYKMW